MLTVIGIFHILPYFQHLNSNIEAQIGLIVLQTCLCHNKVFEVDVFHLCFGIFGIRVVLVEDAYNAFIL